MHTSFTGNSRRPRQVNLSGRNPNPWANLPGSSPAKPQPQAGTHNAVAQAQAERLRRAQDRDRLNAAKKVQRVWRGHNSRTRQKQKWRDEWDQREQARLAQPGRIPYDLSRPNTPVLQYLDEEALRLQMRLLLSFLDTHQEMDRWRLCYWGNTLRSSWSLTDHHTHALVWNKHFTKLSRLLAQAVQKATDSIQRSLLLELAILVLEKPVQLDYDAQFRALNDLGTPDTATSVSNFAQALLLRQDPRAYDALVRYILSTRAIAIYPTMVTFLELRRNQILYCQSVRRACVSNLPVDSLLWVLSNTVYLWRSTSGEDKPVIEWISAVSDALTRCANDVAARVDVIDHPMAGTSTEQHPGLPQFIRQHTTVLARQDSVQAVMREFRDVSSSVEHVAKPLANYAVALLRAFPSKATNIRMWLYQNSPAAASGQNPSSTIQYLWKASQATNVFKSIRADQQDVISVLTEVRPPSNQFGYQAPSQQETAAWQEEWRIVLLFLELYTFILKLMDDEEFFAMDDDLSIRSSLSQQFRQGALPRSDIAVLATFLKHLAFALYWNAVDLAQYNEVEDTTSISVLFGQAASPVPSTPAKPTAKTLAGNDVSQAYMKGLATGLLRMLYERDSRRKFLPDNYWLMTKHFDMQSFIPAVVAEEERRHAAFEENDEDDEFGLDEVEKQDAEDMHAPPDIGSLFNIRAPHTSRSQTSRQAELLTKQREIARKRRQLQSLNPRLELLRNLPFFIPFNTRVQIFRTFIYRDQERRRNGYVEPDDWRMSVAASQGRDLNGRHRGMDTIGRHHADIHRGSVFEDAFENFYPLGEELKEPIQISFIDQFGQPEAGIDGGGVTKEFLMSVTSEAFDPQSEMPLFEENEQRYLYPKPTTMQQAKHILVSDGNRVGTEGYNAAMREILQRYEFLGRIVGKCMYEGILIDVNFAGFFLLKWALTGGTTSAATESAFRASINDLRDFDDQLYQGLLKLKNYPGDVEADFGLNFTVSDTFEIEGKMSSMTTDLIPGGSNELVTNSNRLKYIDRIVRYRLQEQPRLITNAFLKGLGQIISPMWLAMFNQKELQKLVGGDNQELDILDLRRNTLYGGIYVIGDDGLEHPTVALFWKVLREMNDEDRRKVIKFVTSTPRAPLLGFSHLHPKFSIRDSSEDQSRLPSTSTCVNLLKLPRYADERTMREKLLYAANSGAGFDLS